MQLELRRITLVVCAIILSSSLVFGQTYTIGANSGSNATNGYPCPLQDYYKTQRAQYLYQASELAAAGMGAGDITELTWTVTAPYIITDLDGGVIEGYTIKISTTGLSSLTTTGWETVATTVWGPTNYIPVNGANTFTFAAPFNWDGASNIIIEVCGGLSTGNWEENAQVIYTTGLGFNGSRTYRSDSEPSVCTYSGTTFSGTATTRPQVILTASAAVSCAGMPTVGAASSTMESVCATDIFSVSVDPIFEGGITYQWESSSDGITWGTIAGATSAAYSTTQASATWYHCVVTCTATGDVATSGDVYVGQNAPIECYCTPTYTTGTGLGDYMENVTLEAINNTSGASLAPYYTYYAGMAADLVLEGTYTVYATVGTYTNNDIAAWIDYNQDGSFDEVTEKLGQVDGLGAGITGSISFTVPATALTGATRMRVREADQTLTIEACETLTYGETEDYDINISAVDVCDVTTGLWADGITATTAELHWDAAAGATNYHVTVANTATQTIVVKIQAAGTSATVTGLAAGTDYGFQVRTFCVDMGVTAAMSAKYYFSTPARFGEAEKSVILFPNPNTGQFTLALNGYENDNVELNISNSTGQIVYTSSINVTGANHTELIDLDHVAPGMYQVSLTGNTSATDYSIVITE